jgi:hypothetical protein
VDACGSFAPTRIRYDRIPSLDPPRPESPARPTASRKYEFLSAPPGAKPLQVGKVWFPGGPPCRSGRRTSSFRARIERLSRLICPTGCPANFVSSARAKNISLGGLVETDLLIPPSHPTRGALAIVTNAGRDAVDAAAFCVRRDRRAGRKTCERSTARGREMLQRTAKSCGPDTPTLVSSSRRLSRPYRA